MTQPTLVYLCSPQSTFNLPNVPPRPSIPLHRIDVTPLTAPMIAEYLYAYKPLNARPPSTWWPARSRRLLLPACITVFSLIGLFITSHWLGVPPLGRLPFQKPPPEQKIEPEPDRYGLPGVEYPGEERWWTDERWDAVRPVFNGFTWYGAHFLYRDGNTQLIHSLQVEL